MDPIEAIPAYGRDYRTADEVQAAWDAGKDFRDLATGRYLNNADAAKYLEPGRRVEIRYAKVAGHYTRVHVVRA